MASALVSIIPLAFASGLNVYATVAVLGFSAHLGLVALPEQFRVFDNPVIIGTALALYVIEFVADKIPWVDSVWDSIHTLIRPIGGAFIAVASLGNPSPAAIAFAALLGGSVAMTTHLTKAGTRVVANTSPEPLSNWMLSVAEDLLAASLTYVAVRHPMMALIVAALLLAGIAAFARLLWRRARRYLRGRSAPLEQPSRV